MAEEFNDLKQAADAARNAMQGLDDATKKTTTGLDAFGKEASAQSKQLARGMGDFAKNVGKGDTSFKSLNSVVDIAANAMAGLARTIPYAGEGLAAGIKATAEASKFMLEQMDTTTKAFNDLGKVGALGADGMKGLQRQFINSGLGLQTFQKQVGDNAIALARFRGMTGDGAEAFAEIAGKLTRGGDDSLRKLGMSAEQIGESVGAFVTQQTRLGRAQNMTSQELANGTKRYAVELDALQKVTGMSREAIMKQQDAALSESRFRASIHSLNEQQQKDLLGLQTVMSSFGAEMGQGTRDLVSGAANTDAARKLMVDTGGAAQDIISRLKSGTISQTQAQQEMQAAIKANLEAGKNYSQFADGTSSQMGDFAAKADLAAAKLVDGKLVKDAQNSQINRTDELTDQTIKAQKNMEGLNIEMNKLGFTFLPKAATAVESMTGAMEKFVKYVNKTLGAALDEGTGVGRGVPGAPGSSSGAETGDAGGGSGGADVGGVASDAEIAAARKSVAAGGQAPTTAVAPAAAPVAGGGAAGGGPPGINPEDFVKFTGGTGSKDHFNKLEPGVRERFLKMAQDYNNLTGKKLQVNSAFRSPEEQAAVNPGTNPKAAPGMSLHNVGRALDIQSDQRQYLESAGLLGTYGFKPLAGDPPHISAASGAIISGPTSGYKPNLTMHGTEAIVPLNGSTANAAGLGTDPGVMMAQLEKMDEMISVLKSQLSVSTKLLAYSS
jgi:hypothetical protein